MQFSFELNEKGIQRKRKKKKVKRFTVCNAETEIEK